MSGTGENVTGPLVLETETPGGVAVAQADGATDERLAGEHDAALADTITAGDPEAVVGVAPAADGTLEAADGDDVEAAAGSLSLDDRRTAVLAEVAALLRDHGDELSAADADEVAAAFAAHDAKYGAPDGDEQVAEVEEVADDKGHTDGDGDGKSDALVAEEDGNGEPDAVAEEEAVVADADEEESAGDDKGDPEAVVADNEVVVADDEGERHDGVEEVAGSAAAAALLGADIAALKPANGDTEVDGENAEPVEGGTSGDVVVHRDSTEAEVADPTADKRDGEEGDDVVAEDGELAEGEEAAVVAAAAAGTGRRHRSYDEMRAEFYTRTHAHKWMKYAFLGAGVMTLAGAAYGVVAWFQEWWPFQHQVAHLIHVGPGHQEGNGQTGGGDHTGGSGTGEQTDPGSGNTPPPVDNPHAVSSVTVGGFDKSIDPANNLFNGTPDHTVAVYAHDHGMTLSDDPNAAAGTVDVRSHAFREAVDHFLTYNGQNTDGRTVPDAQQLFISRDILTTGQPYNKGA